MVKKSVFYLFGVLGVLLLAEVSLFALAQVWSKTDSILQRPGLKNEKEIRHHLPNAQLGHRPNPEYPGHDLKGFRNERVPEPGDVDLVAMGDSQTYGSGVKEPYPWPRQLSKLGGLQTYNLAFGGYGPAHSLILLEEAIAFRPRLIIEAFYAGNDLVDAYSVVFSRNQLGELKTVDAGVLQSIAEAEKNNPTRAKIAKEFDLSRGLRPGEDEASGNFVLDRSRLVALWKAVKRYYRTRKTLFGTLEELARAYPESLYILNRGNIRTVLTPTYRLLAIDQEDPRNREGLEIIFRSLVAMKRKTETKNIEFLVLLIPTKEYVFAEMVEETGGRVPKSYPRLIENETRVFQKLRKFLDAEQIAHVSALPALRAVLKEGNLPYKISADGHPNARGQAAIANAVFLWLSKKGLVEN